MHKKECPVPEMIRVAKRERVTYLFHAWFFILFGIAIPQLLGGSPMSIALAGLSLALASAVAYLIVLNDSFVHKCEEHMQKHHGKDL